VGTTEKAKKLKLWGREAFRDIGILLIVFGPVDALLKAAHITDITAREWALAVVSMSWVP